jgi:DNA-directed RNA polymerase specialized sigma24 family protein
MAPSHPSMLSSENDDASLTERLVSKDLTPEELLRRLEIREMFKHHIEKPSPSLRTVFLLRIMHERRANATARILRVPINTVKARLWRAPSTCQTAEPHFIPRDERVSNSFSSIHLASGKLG